MDMYNWIWYIDLFVLATSGALCALAVFSTTFEDNLFQRIGLAILCIASWGRMYAVWNYGYGHEIYVWYHAGIWFFAVGTYAKYYIRGFAAKHFQWWQQFPYDRRKNGLHD